MKKILFTFMATVAMMAMTACCNNQASEPAAEDTVAAQCNKPCDKPCDKVCDKAQCPEGCCQCGEECKAAKCEGCTKCGTPECCGENAGKCCKKDSVGEGCKKACEAKCPNAQSQNGGQQ